MRYSPYHGFKPDLWGAVVGKLTGVPVIISTVHKQERYLKDPIIKFLEKRIISAIDDVIIAISDGIKRFLIETSGISENKIKRIYYGINPLKNIGKTINSFVIKNYNYEYRRI